MGPTVGITPGDHGGSSESREVSATRKSLGYPHFGGHGGDHERAEGLTGITEGITVKRAKKAEKEEELSYESSS